jgi:hypothetical protein
VPQTLSAGGGIPRAAPLHAPDPIRRGGIPRTAPLCAPDPIRRGRNTQRCTFVIRSGFVPDGPRATDAASLAVDGGTTRAVVRRGAVGGIARESVIVAGSGASNGRETGVRIAASGGGWCWTDAAVGMAVIGQRCGLGTAAMASPERADSCCDGSGVFSWDARERCIASRLFSHAMSACAVPAVRCRCTRCAALSRFSGVDFECLRVRFVAGCALLGTADRFIVRWCGVPCAVPMIVV